MSADVAGGHDAAARAIATQFKAELGGDVEVVIDNGLASAGWVLHHVVRDIYHLMLLHTSHLYSCVFWVAGRPRVTRVAQWLLYAFWGRRLLRRIRQENPDLIVTTFHVLTAILAGLRRSGHLEVPVIASVTDIDPHLLWFARGIDLHCVSTQSDVVRIARRLPDAPVVAMRPPVDELFLSRHSRSAATQSFGLPGERRVVLVCGGAWGVGKLEDAIDPLLVGTDAFCVVACGRNNDLQRKLEAAYPANRLRALTYCEDMPNLLAACDAIVHTAAGMTCFEALAQRVPVIVFNAIEGHGRVSARALQEDGLAVWAHTPGQLVEAVHQVTSRIGPPVAQMFDLPTLAEQALSLDGQVAPAPARRRPVRRARNVATVLAFTCILATLSSTVVSPLVLAGTVRREAGELRCQAHNRISRFDNRVHRRRAPSKQSCVNT